MKNIVASENLLCRSATVSFNIFIEFAEFSDKNICYLLIMQKNDKNYHFMSPCIFCESVISDNSAQTGLNWLTNFTVLIPIEIIPGQKLLSQI